LLLITLAKVHPKGGNILMDEMLSVLMPLFIGNPNPIGIQMCKKLWELNKDLMVRSICEICRHEQ